MATPEGLCTKCSATHYCLEHAPELPETVEVMCDGNGECFRLEAALSDLRSREIQLVQERDDALADAAYHSECRPNRRQAEKWRDDAKALNDWRADVTSAVIVACGLDGGLHYDDVRQRIKELGALRSREVRWKEIESAPKDGTWFIALLADGEVVRASWGRSRFHGMQWCTSVNICFPTHWMPLPEPPADLLALEAAEAPILDAQG